MSAAHPFEQQDWNRLISRILAVVLFLLSILPPALAAQATGDTAAIRRAVEQRFGRDVPMNEVLERLRQSGVSRQEMRAQLRLMGLDPALADQYFDAMQSGRGSFVGDADQDFVAALRQMGLLSAPVPEDSLPPGLPDSVRITPSPPDSVERGELPLFGRTFFRDTLFTIDPMVMGPVDRDYAVGPGDLLTVILTGAVELAYGLTVGRDGTVVIPEVGQVFVSGMTLDQVEARLLPTLRQVYTDVGPGPEALTRLSVSLGRVRAVQVYVSGDVERPGSHTVSSLSTVMDVLQRAGGPSRQGSFRNVLVRRRGEPSRRIDLYDYLVRGDRSGDERLRQGDVVFVPPAGPRVGIEGAVQRPAIYEVLPGEDLVTVLEYAGGILPQAAARQVRIERILSPAERSPGVDRVVLTADLVTIAQGSADAPRLAAGDHVVVPAISDDRRRFIGLHGAVNRPGTYAWEPGLDLDGLLAAAQGPAERALLDRVHVFRHVPGDPNRVLFRVDLTTPEAGGFGLIERDSVVVYRRDALAVREWVRISGRVKSPGTYPYARGMSPMDLVIAAGGFAEGAYRDSLDVVRAADEVGDTTATFWRLAAGGEERDNGQYTVATANTLPLVADDEVHVLTDPAYALPRSVVITGEVRMPGPYPLIGKVERLRDVLARAGGTTDAAYTPGIRVHRGGEVVSTDTRKALDSPDSPANVPMSAGDSVHVPRFDPTIRVHGAVTYPGYVAYRSGANLEYYIEQAGGYRADADERRVAITAPDGRRQTAARGLLSRTPVPLAGSEIYVPEQSPASARGLGWGEMFTRTAALASTIAGLLFAIAQLR